MQGLNDAIVVRKNVVKGTTNTNKEVLLRGWFHEKKVTVLLDFVHMREGGPCPNFCHLFIIHFWSKPGPHFLQNANDLNFKLFLGCIHAPQSKYSAFI